VRRHGVLRGTPAVIRRHITARVRARPGDEPAVRPALELGAAIAPGDSGAPLVDRGGRVAGVVFARSDRRPDTAYALDAGALTAFLRAARQR
jgi:S1-C subfamily serine protease